MNANGTLIQTLSNSSLYRDYAEAYTEVIGLPLALRPVQSWQLPFHRQRKESPFCRLLAAKSRTCATCLQMQEKLSQSAMQHPCTVTCASGLSETAVPVRLANETLGFLQTGQVFQQRPTQGQFNRVAERLEKVESGLDHDLLKAAYFATAVVSPEKMNSTASLLSIFADQLAVRVNQIAVQRANGEPPAIAQAKQFILEHHSERLSLGQVANAVHVSIFYFCKLFHKAVGINFTEFVSRARIDRAKGLLLNPNLRVSEIAYEVGFQSLTNFNRTFKAIVGESATEFRGHLPAGRVDARWHLKTDRLHEPALA